MPKFLSFNLKKIVTLSGNTTNFPLNTATSLSSNFLLFLVALTDCRLQTTLFAKHSVELLTIHLPETVLATIILYLLIAVSRELGGGRPMKALAIES